MREKKGFNCVFIIFIFVLSLIFTLSFSSGESANSRFDVNALLLKVTLNEGDSVSKTISISSKNGGDFSLEFLNLNGISLSQKSFILSPAESKAVEVFFDASPLKAGVYVGSIKISESSETYLLPVIFEVQSKDILVGVNLDIPPQYTDIPPGGKIVAQLKLFDLTAEKGAVVGLGSSRIDLNYYVYNTEGSLLSSESENIVINEQAQVTKTISLPASVKEGDYVFGVTANYKSSVSTSSRLFRVASQKENYFSGAGQIIWIIVIFIAFFFGLIFLFVYLIKDRDKIILQLKEYNEIELKRQKELLEAQAKIARGKKGFRERVIRKEIKEKIGLLRRKQQKRVTAFRKLKKKGDINEMVRMLEGWKKQGYNTLALEYKLKGLSKNEMLALIKNLKK